MNRALQRLLITLLVPVLIAPGGVSAHFCMMALAFATGSSDCCTVLRAVEHSAAAKRTGGRRCCAQKPAPAQAPIDRPSTRGVNPSCPLCVSVTLPELSASAPDRAEVAADFALAPPPALVAAFLVPPHAEAPPRVFARGAGPPGFPAVTVPLRC